MMAMIIFLLGSTLSQISPSVSFCSSNGGLSPTIISLSPDPPRLGNQQFFINATVVNPGMSINQIWIFGDLTPILVDNLINFDVTVGHYDLFNFRTFQLSTQGLMNPGTYPTVVQIKDAQDNNDLCIEFNITIPEPVSNAGSSCLASSTGYVFAYNYTFSTITQNFFTVYMNIMTGVQGFNSIQSARIDLYSNQVTYLNSSLYFVNTSNNNIGDFNNFTFLLPMLPKEPGTYYYTIKLVDLYDFESYTCWNFNHTVNSAYMIVMSIFGLCLSLIV